MQIFIYVYTIIECMIILTRIPGDFASGIFHLLTQDYNMHQVNNFNNVPHFSLEYFVLYSCHSIFPGTIP